MKTLLLISFTLLFSIAYAQPKVVTFGDENDNYQIDQQNIIKLNIFEVLAGDFPIYYERSFFKNFTAEVGLGVTFGDFLGFDFFDDGFSDFGFSNSNRLGYSFSAALRFYPSDLFDGIYISPEFKYRKYNWDREYVNVQNSTIETAKESRTYTLPRIMFGYAVLYDNNISFDWSIGIGMNTPTEHYINTNGVIESFKHNTRPKLSLGLKIGYVF